MKEFSEHFKGREALSREKTLKARRMELQKMPRWKVAEEMNCSEKTLYRAYKRYKNEIRELENSAESMSLLQENTQD